jgi:protocatechuate 3,4-dioxygenase beta subunit
MRLVLIFVFAVVVALPGRVRADDAASVPVGEIAGTVTDEADQPLEGAVVHCWTWYPRNQTKTDKSGHFDLKGLEKDTPVEVRVTLKGYSPWYELNQPTGVADLKITLNDKTFFEGKVTKPDGKPLAGALVRADSSPKKNKRVLITHVWSETKTDEQGHYKLFVAPDKYEIEVRDPKIGVVNVSATAGENEGITQDLQLQDGIRLIINCLDAGDKKPIPGVRVRVADHKGMVATSDQNGQAILEHMAAEKIELDITSDTHMRWSMAESLNERQHDLLTNQNWSSDGPELELSGSPNPITLYMEKGVGCSGHVVDPQGQPVMGAIVVTSRVGGYADAVDQTERFMTHTKEDGSFSFMMPACEDQINLIAHDGEYDKWRHWANGVSEPFDAVTGTNHDDITIKLTEPTTIRGQVVNQAGAAVADVGVRAIGADDRDSRYVAPEAKTDQNGNFELKYVRPGEVLVQVEPFWMKQPGGRSPTPTITAERVTVKPGEVKEGIQITQSPQGQPPHSAGL